MKALNALKLLLLTYFAPESLTAGQRTRRMDDAGAVSLSSLGGFALSIVAVVIGAVVALVVIASLFPTYAGAVKNLSQNVTNADFGNATANSLLSPFALLISLGGLFAIVGLAFLAYSIKGPHHKA